MTDMPTAFAPDDADHDGRINGVIDVPRPGRVAGWAIDRADQNATVSVSILREGRLVAELRADAHRPDLERGGIGTGRYGFSLDLEPPLEPGFEFTISAIARAADGTSGDLRAVGRAKPSGDADRRLAERTFAEVVKLRALLDVLSAHPKQDGEALLMEALERVEVVQARIEQAQIERDNPVETGSSRGLALTVAGALAISTGSLALGIWSMLAG